MRVPLAMMEVMDRMLKQYPSAAHNLMGILHAQGVPYTLHMLHKSQCTKPFSSGMLHLLDAEVASILMVSDYITTAQLHYILVMSCCQHSHTINQLVSKFVL